LVTRWYERTTPLIVVSWFVLNAPLLLGFRVLPGDAVNEFYPMVYFNVESLRSGSFPWWNPYIFSGYPQAADPQAMLFSPLMTLWMLLVAKPGMAWFVWAVTLHILMGGLAFAALLRRFGASQLGIVLGALVFMCGGVAASRLQHVPIVVTYGFLAVGMLCTIRLVDLPSIGRGLALGLAGAGMALQPVQLTFLSFWMLVAFLGGALWRGVPRMSRSERLRLLAALGLAGAMCGTLFTPQLALTTAFLAVSNRPSLDIAVANEMSVGWDSLLTLVVPNALQSLRGTYNGSVDRIETFLYIGSLPLALCLMGMRHRDTWIAYRRIVVFSGLVLSVSLVFALGRHTPVYAWFYEFVPGVSLFRRPSDALYLANIALAFFVAIFASGVTGTSATRHAMILATILSIIAAATMRGHDEGWFVASAIAPVTAAVVGLWVVRQKRPASFVVAVVSCVVVDYRCFNVNGEFNHFRDTPKRYLDEGAINFLATRMAESPSGLPARVEATGLGAVWKNMGVASGLQGTQGYGPLRWSLYDRWYGAYGDGNGPRPVTIANLSPAGAMNSLLGVRYVVTAAGEPMAPEVSVAYLDGKTAVYELEGAQARIQAPMRAHLVNGPEDEIMRRVNAAHTADEVVLVPRSPSETGRISASIGQCVGRALVHSTDWGPNRHAMMTEHATAAWLVVAELDFPGWVARIDGKEVEHFRANGMFRALCVPGGTHAVSFAFEPWRMIREVWLRADDWR
jgi:hypothetical protein